MAIDREMILERLRSIEDPQWGKNLVELDAVSNIKIGGGNVGLDLVLTPEIEAAKDEIRKACIDAVRAIPEVAHVSVNMTKKTQAAKPAGRSVMESVDQIIAVASGKGGVAKSTTAVNLAIALKEQGARVGILDADIYGPSVPMMLATDTPPKPEEGNRLYPAEAMGVKFISMAFFMPKDQAAILRGPMVSGYVTQFLSNVIWGELDYVIIDYPPGTGDIQLTLSQKAPITGALVVTTPQDVALADVRRAVAMFETTKVPVLGVCETMSYFICDECNKKHYIFRRGGGPRIAAQLGVPFLGEIPLDPKVAESGDAGVPIVAAAPQSVAAEAYRAVAASVAEQLKVFKAEMGDYLESFTLEWAR